METGASILDIALVHPIVHEQRIVSCVYLQPHANDGKQSGRVLCSIAGTVDQVLFSFPSPDLRLCLFEDRPKNPSGSSYNGCHWWLQFHLSPFTRTNIKQWTATGSFPPSFVDIVSSYGPGDGTVFKQDDLLEVRWRRMGKPTYSLAQSIYTHQNDQHTGRTAKSVESVS